MPFRPFSSFFDNSDGSDNPGESPRRASRRRWLEQFLLRRLNLFQALDSILFLNINSLPHPKLFDRSMQLLAVVMNRGDGWLLGLLVAAFADRAKGRKALLGVVPALWLATATVEFPIKALFQRKRPYISLVKTVVVGEKPRSHSFPSGHSATAFAGAWLLRKYYPNWSRLHYTVAALVGFCRVYLGVHYPSDVVVGAAAGTLLAAGYRRGLAQLFPDIFAEKPMVRP